MCTPQDPRTSLDIEDLVQIAKSKQRFTEITRLQEMVRETFSRKLTTRVQVDQMIRQYLDSWSKDRLKVDRTQFTPINLLMTYRMMCTGESPEFTYNPEYERLFRTKEMRSLSGVLVLATFTHPYPETSAGIQPFSCKYDCLFCPLPIVTDPETGEKKEYPRSYPPKGPATQRADRNDFDTLEQFLDRTTQYLIMGHPIDKIELIVLGGTWHSYPTEYRRNFIRDNFWIANHFYDILYARLHDLPLPPKRSMEEEIHFNRNPSAPLHLIGVTIETRPDQLSLASLAELREMAVTRVQLGIQHTQDVLLERINRQCTHRQNAYGIMLALAMGFKIDIHLMPDLVAPLNEAGKARIKEEMAKLDRTAPDYRDQKLALLETVDPETEVAWSPSVREMDIGMFEYVISHGWGDEWKIYPMEAVDFTPIPRWHQLGIHRSYFEEYDLSGISEEEWAKMKPKHQRKYRQTHNPYHDLMVETLPQIPAHVRVTRLNRDIPLENIRGGNDAINGRQYIEEEVKARGMPIREMRTREIRQQDYDPTKAVLNLRPYWIYAEDPEFASFQIMFEFIDPETETLFAFLRWGAPPQGLSSREQKQLQKRAPELIEACFLRELHTYGQVIEVGGEAGNSQHLRFGTRLIQAMEHLVYHQLGYRKIAVISGAGVETYYEDYGRRYHREFAPYLNSDQPADYAYRREGNYMTKTFWEPPQIEPELGERLSQLWEEVAGPVFRNPPLRPVSASPSPLALPPPMVPAQGLEALVDESLLVEYDSEVERSAPPSHPPQWQMEYGEEWDSMWNSDPFWGLDDEMGEMGNRCLPWALGLFLFLWVFPTLLALGLWWLE